MIDLADWNEALGLVLRSCVGTALSLLQLLALSWVILNLLDNALFLCLPLAQCCMFTETLIFRQAHRFLDTPKFMHSSELARLR